MTKARFDVAAVKTAKDGVSAARRAGGRRRPRRSAPSCCSWRPAGRPTSRRSASRRRRSRSSGASIKVNGRMRTREPHVYAIGDVIGGLWLAHTAAHEGIVAAHTIAGEKDVPEIDYTEQPRAHLLPAGDRLGRPDRAAVPGARPARTRSARFPSRRSPRRSSAASTRASPRSSPTPRRATRSASTSIGPHATDLIAEASLGVRARGDALGDRRGDPSAPDAVRGRRRGGPGRRRPVDQLLTTRGRHDRDRARRARRPDTRDISAPRRASTTPSCSRCTGWSPSPGPSTSGCGSSTGPAGSRS